MEQSSCHMTPALLAAQLSCRGRSDSMQNVTRNSATSHVVGHDWLYHMLTGVDSLDVEAMVGVWWVLIPLQKGPLKLNAQCGCGGPCQPRSSGVGGLGQEAQSKITCCQPRCTTPSESTCEVHRECTIHSVCTCMYVCTMQYTVYVHVHVLVL